MSHEIRELIYYCLTGGITVVVLFFIPIICMTFIKRHYSTNNLDMLLTNSSPLEHPDHLVFYINELSQL